MFRGRQRVVQGDSHPLDVFSCFPAWIIVKKLVISIVQNRYAHLSYRNFYHIHVCSASKERLYATLFLRGR